MAEKVIKENSMRIVNKFKFEKMMQTRVPLQLIEDNFLNQKCKYFQINYPHFYITKSRTHGIFLMENIIK